jgi:HK97 family phage portal protein
MGFLDRFLPARKAEANEAVVSAVINATDNGFTSPDASYGNFAQEGYAGNELVFACIREIATSTAEANLVLYDANHEAIANSPLANLIAKPAEGQTQYEFLENLITHLQIAGNAYVLKERARVGVVSLMLLRPDRMSVVPGGGYSYEVGGKKYMIPDEDIGHLKFPNPNNDFYGLSPLQVLAKQINLDTDATTFTKAYFNNAGVPSGILKLRRKLSNQDEADRLRSAWHNKFQGNRNWHRIAILDEDATYEKMGGTLGEMEIPALRNLSESRICSALGVPAILVGANIGLQRSTFSNYAEARESFWEETLLPLYRRIEQFMVGLLEPEFPRERGQLEFDFSEVRALQEDEDSMVNRQLVRAQIASQLITAGFTPDAALQAAGIDDELEHTGFLPTSLSVLGQQPVQGKESKALTQAAANRLVEPLEESYDDEVDAMERVLEKFFREQLNRADGIMGRYLSDSTESDTKIQMPFNEITLIPLAADAELSAAMSPTLIKTMGRAWDTINAANVFTPMPFDPELPIFSNVLRNAGTKINDVSRSALRKQLQVGNQAGYSLDQIVRGVPKDDYRGLRSVVRETYKNRSKTIARTEVATAQNTGTAGRYKAAGVTEVIIQDGDLDDLCAPYDGTRQSIDWALDNPIAHPNCTRAYSAVIDGVTE